MNDGRRPLFVLGSFMAACCAMVDRLPRPGETVRANRFTLEPGGKGFNVAIGARRLGADVDCMLAVGDDFFGGMAEPALARNGLSTTLLRRYPIPNGAGIGLIQSNGENSIAVYNGANFEMSASDVWDAAGRVEQAAMIVAQFEISDEPIAAAFAIARSAGRPTLLNPSPFRPIATGILVNTSILVVNEQEAGDLAAMRGLGIDPAPGKPPSEVWIDLAASLHGDGVELLVVTLGSKGAVAFPRDGKALCQAAFPIDAIDTLGAGDAFIAAFAVRFIEDGSVADALQRAAAGGALTASKNGTIDAFPDSDEINRFIKKAFG